MAQEKDLLEELSTQEAPISAGDLAKQVNASVESVSTQLKRLKEKGMVTGGKEGWSITDTSRESITKSAVSGPSGLSGPSMIEEGATPYDSFCEIGRRIGLNTDRVKLAADMIFSGDYEDLKWVWEALTQQGIRNDIKSIWFNNWRVLIKKPVPPEIAGEVFQAVAQVDKRDIKENKDEKGERDYVLVDDMPVRVGQGVGDFDLQTAKELAALRALKDRFGRGGTGTAVEGPRTMDERLPELITALAAFREKPDQRNVEGLLDKLSESRLDALKQDLISRIPQQSVAKSFMDQLTDFITGLQSVGPMLRPLLGIPEQGQGQGQGPQQTPIQLSDASGNPIVMDINSLISWKKFEGEEKRAENEQKNKQEMAGTLKDFLGKIASAAGKVASRE